MSRGVQYRLLLLVFSLMLVVVMMGEAAKPQTWAWMFGNEVSGTDEVQVPAEESIDPRLPATADDRVTPMPAGVVTIRPFEPAAEPDPPRSELEIPLHRYARITDDTVFRSEESQVWFETLAALDARCAAAETLAVAESIPSVGFTQLFQQPDEYRGRMVAVRGVVRRAHKIVAQRNEQGIQSYWQCWLFPDGTTNPIVVYALDMPDDFPPGMSIQEVAEFQGVFFKRWAYSAEGGAMSAPLVLAAIGNWHPAPPAARMTYPSPVTLALASGVVGLAAILVAITVYRRSTNQSEYARAFRQCDDQAELAIQSLHRSKVQNPADAIGAQLREMEAAGDGRQGEREELSE